MITESFKNLNFQKIEEPWQNEVRHSKSLGYVDVIRIVAERFSIRVDKVNVASRGGRWRRMHRLCTRDPHSAPSGADFANDEANRKEGPLPASRLVLAQKLHRTSTVFQGCGRSTRSSVRFRFIDESLQRISRTLRGMDIKKFPGETGMLGVVFLEI